MTGEAGSNIGSRNLWKCTQWPSRGFAILDNHLHLLVRLDPDVARGWSDDVVRRWGRLFPPRDTARQVVAVTEEWVQARLNVATPQECFGLHQSRRGWGTFCPATHHARRISSRLAG